MDKEKFIETYIKNENVKDYMKKEAQEYLEMKAVSYAYKKLLSKINKKRLEAKRTFPSDKFLLVIGYSHFNLMEQYSEFNYSRLDKTEQPDMKNLIIWGMPILVSYEKDIIEIVSPAAEFFCGFDPNPSGQFNPLVDMDKLIEELPEDGKGDLDE